MTPTTHGTLLVLLTLGCGVLSAQAPSPWADISLPGGVNTSQVSSLGKLTVYRESTTLFVFSAVTRRWHATNASPTATLFLTNDCLLVQDGATWSAFAAARGTFATLPVSPLAVLLNPASQTNDEILAVRDGNLLHTFTGFVGTWRSRQVMPGANVATKRNVLLLAQGTLLTGMDAYSGQWHDLAVGTTPTTLNADGAAGIAIAAPLVHAFSANHGTWQTAPLPAGATMDRDDDWVLFHSPAEMLGYSGQQGRFEYAALGAVAVVASEDHFAICDTAIGLVPFSAIRGSFGPPLGPNTASVTTGTSVALITEQGSSTGYSAVRNSVATIAANPAQESATGIVAVSQAASGNQWQAFSAVTGQWHLAPADVLPSAPLLTTTTVLFETTTGLRAFAGLSGTFVPLIGAGLHALGSPSSAIAAAWDSSHLHAFDTRTERWRSVPRAGGATPPLVQIWRTTLQATDGALAYGFGAQGGEWSTTPLPELFATGRTNSESGSLLTTTRVLGFSPLPEISGWPQFPAFRRVLTTGATARLSLPLGANDVAIVAFGWQGAPLAVPGLGELLLEPATMVSNLLLPAPGEFVRHFDLAFPRHPALIGASIGVQPLLLRSGRQPYLGDATILSIW